MSNTLIKDAEKGPVIHECFGSSIWTVENRKLVLHDGGKVDRRIVGVVAKVLKSTRLTWNSEKEIWE